MAEHRFLGLNGLVVKTHGSSRAKEITNSIYQCVTFREENINEIIKEKSCRFPKIMKKNKKGNEVLWNSKKIKEDYCGRIKRGRK